MKQSKIMFLGLQSGLGGRPLESKKICTDIYR